MNARFEAFYRGLLVLLAVGLFWVMGYRPFGAKAAESPGGGAGAATAAPAVPAPGATPAATASTNAAPAPAGTGTNTAAVDSSILGGKGIHLLPTIDRQYLTFGLDRVPFLRERVVLGIPLWQYIASFLFIFGAFYVSKFLDYTARIWLRRWAEKTSSRADDMLLELAHGPVKIVAFVILLHVGLSVFQWPPTVERWISNVLKVVVGLSITYAALKIVDIAVGAWRQRAVPNDDRSFDQQLGPILRKALKALVVVVAALVTLDNVGVNINGLIASLSIGGLALGLAAQDTVANLFGAVAVLVDKPFVVGDRVRFEGVDGTVESIGLRSTRIRNLDGHLITVPNKTMGNTTITNITLRPTIRTVMNLGLTYDTTPEKVVRATEILREVMKSHPSTQEVSVGFNRFADSSLNIEVVHVWNNVDADAHREGLQQFNLEIKRRFDAERIEFAYPTQTLFVKREPVA
jgi:MscS family membrane protein